MLDLIYICIVYCTCLWVHVVLMPWVRNSNVNSQQSRHIYFRNPPLAALLLLHWWIHVGLVEGSETGRFGRWAAVLSSFTSRSIQAPLKKTQHAVRFTVRSTWLKRKMKHKWKEAAVVATHWSRTCLPLSEQNDQVHVGRTLADSEREGKGRFDVHTHAETESMQGVSLKCSFLRIRWRDVWKKSSKHWDDNSQFRTF